MLVGEELKQILSVTVISLLIKGHFSPKVAHLPKI